LTGFLEEKGWHNFDTVFTNVTLSVSEDSKLRLSYELCSKSNAEHTVWGDLPDVSDPSNAPLDVGVDGIIGSVLGPNPAWESAMRLTNEIAQPRPPR